MTDDERGEYEDTILRLRAANRRLTVECAAWRSGRLWLSADDEFVYEEHGYPTITDAVDALMDKYGVTEVEDAEHK